MILGALLAGGEGRRAGGDKAGLIWQGETLGARALTLLRRVTDEVVVVGHGRGVPGAGAGTPHPGGPADDAEPVARIDDAADCQGPLAGAIAALRYGATRGARGVLLLPLDMPDLDAGLLRALIARADADRAHGDRALSAGTLPLAALACDRGGRVAPLPACLDPRHHAPLAAVAHAGTTGLRAALLSLPLGLVDAGAGGDGARLGSLNVLPPAPEPKARAIDGVSAERWRDFDAGQLRRRALRPDRQSVAGEAPLQLLLGPLPLAVLMRTPGDDLDLARGFCLTERIVPGPDAIELVAFCDEVEQPLARGHVVRVTPAAGLRIDATALQRSSFVGSSCGVCGKASVERALQTAPPLPPGRAPWPAAALDGLGDRLRSHQGLFAATGGTHGVALFDRSGEIRLCREDVGRHNAADKVIGAAARGEAGLAWPLAEVGMLVSGRISFEMVQKALAAGIDMVVGVSAPTTLAIELGELAGVTVVAFCRGHRATVFAGARRVVVGG